MEKVYYIYYHIDPRTQMPRYIGKGTERRAWAMYGRNKKHRAWIQELKNMNLKPIVFIGNKFTIEEIAYNVEEIEIGLFRKLNIELVNITKGGMGCKSDKIKKPIICLNNNITYLSTKEAGDILQIPPKRINDVLKGRKRSYKGFQFKYQNENLNIETYKIRKSKEYNKKHTTSKNITCNETGKHYISITEAAKDIGVTNSSLCSHLNGKIKTIKKLTFRRGK